MKRPKMPKIGRLSIPVEESELENGVRIVTAQNKSTYGVSITVGNCANREARKWNGVRHFLEHMITRGSPDANGRRPDEKIEFAGANWEAYTEGEWVEYHLDVPSWKMAEKLLPIMAEQVVRPSLSGKEVDTEHGVILSEIYSGHDEVSTFAAEKAIELLFAKKQVALFIRGTDESLKNITSKRLRELHSRKYTAGRLFVVGAGRINHEDLVRVAKQCFGSLPENRTRFVFPVEDVRNTGRIEYRETRQSNHASYLLMAFNVSPILHHREDIPAFLLLMSILGGAGTATRTYNALRRNRGCGYCTNIANADLSQSYAVATFETECQGVARLEECEKTILSEIERTRNELVSKYERLGHVRQLRAKIRDKAYNPEDLRDELVNQMLAKTPYDIFAAYYKAGKVTAADLRRVARTYLDAQNYSVVRIEGSKH